MWISDIQIGSFVCGKDAFLPHVEDGTIVLIGATTENPSFHVNNALLSRCKVFVLEKLSVQNIEKILRKTLVELRVGVLSEDARKTENVGSCGFVMFNLILGNCDDIQRQRERSIIGPAMGKSYSNKNSSCFFLCDHRKIIR